LAERNSQVLVDMILNVCGTYGMPYDAMQALLNRPEVVYESFKSTLGERVCNYNGASRGYALWVLYAAARQCFTHATSYVVDDMFYVDVHSNNGQDEDLDTILNELGIYSEMNPGLDGYDLRKVDERFYFMPSPLFVNNKLNMLIEHAQQKYWDDHPEELNAHMLQLAYVLNPTTTEFSAILGLLQQTSRFVPNINCITGSVPVGLPDLIASNDTVKYYSSYEVIKNTMAHSFDIKRAVSTFHTVMHRTFRHYARHANEKEWFIDGNMLSATAKAQMRKELFDRVLDVSSTDWGPVDEDGWAN